MQSVLSFVDLDIIDFWNTFGLALFIQGQLREAIRDMVLRCPQTLFIFDEAEKLHPGLIDAIKPYMDHYDNVDGVSYRRAIFLFLRLVYISGTSCLLKLAQKTATTQTVIHLWLKFSGSSSVMKDVSPSVSLRRLYGFFMLSNYSFPTSTDG